MNAGVACSYPYFMHRAAARRPYRESPLPAPDFNSGA